MLVRAPSRHVPLATGPTPVFGLRVASDPSSWSSLSPSLRLVYLGRLPDYLRLLCTCCNLQGSSPPK